MSSGCSFSEHCDQRGAASSEPCNDRRERDGEENEQSELAFTPTEFIGVMNQTLEYAYSSVVVTGEVASFKVNQGKWVFFDIKDEESSVPCFMTLWSLRMPIEDGMKVAVRGAPKVTKWGKFSFTVTVVQPVGEGSLKRAYEKLKKKLAAEGLFDPLKKRPIATDLTRIGVISSVQAAGYADFMKIVNARWGGMKISVAHCQVQGMSAPDQIIRALRYFNERAEVEAIVLIRGGGSADDLACFNDEALVREVASSRIPVMTGIGHEVDESLCDLAADVRASTPSNAAELLTKDRKEELERLRQVVGRTSQTVLQAIVRAQEYNKQVVGDVYRKMAESLDGALFLNHSQLEKAIRALEMKYIEPILVRSSDRLGRMWQKLQLEYKNLSSLVVQKMKVLEVVNPEKVLKQGYAILTGKISPGDAVKITTFRQEIKAEVKEIYERKR